VATTAADDERGRLLVFTDDAAAVGKGLPLRALEGKEGACSSMPPPGRDILGSNGLACCC